MLYPHPQNTMQTKPVPITSALIPPTTPGEWTLAQIQQAISRELPESLLSTRRQGGQVIKYIPWYLICAYIAPFPRNEKD